MRFAEMQKASGMAGGFLHLTIRQGSGGQVQTRPASGVTSVSAALTPRS